MSEMAATGSGAPAWVPGDACTLPTADRPLRVAEFDALFASAVRGVERPDAGRLRLRLSADVEASARELVARESSCCSFFDFRFIPGEEELLLDVRVPDGRVEVLDGLERRARAA